MVGISTWAKSQPAGGGDLRRVSPIVEQADPRCKPKNGCQAPLAPVLRGEGAAFPPRPGTPGRGDGGEGRFPCAKPPPSPQPLSPGYRGEGKLSLPSARGTGARGLWNSYFRRMPAPPDLG